jgi:hypothetical protein
MKKKGKNGKDGKKIHKPPKEGSGEEIRVYFGEDSSHYRRGRGTQCSEEMGRR